MPSLTRTATLLLAGLISSAAFAQSPDAPLKGRDTDPALPPPNQTIPDKIRPESGDATGSTLSDKLEKSDGVIKPPAGISPDMTVAPPVKDPGGMPVIKPGQLPGNGEPK
ncbi:hypothetical protein ASG40_01300 [Methylobacterium sp. Leaf399]|uniref:hypothetical protein n=1 Tax=Methylobacterium sp. Leaf399 TaxID=1736364 RepID=UPI0007008728|nr:hypothetical protein [Methylobacterium sp. Leaf399]KQT19508.1 hypothetical protein ASG40_01300 [Methylobacterium sp. Leaf399]